MNIHNVGYDSQVPEFASVSEAVAKRLAVEAVYAPMMQRQQMSIDS